MTPAVRRFVETIVREQNLRATKTLDIGSYNVNGCVRDLFSDYLGYDMQPGPNVDVVGSAHDIPRADNTFDTVLCLEMLEHDSAFWESIPEMKRVLKPGGTLIITTRGIGFPHHDYPQDFWRFTEASLKLLLFENMTNIIVFEDGVDQGVFGTARKV